MVRTGKIFALLSTGTLLSTASLAQSHAKVCFECGSSHTCRRVW